MPFKLNIDEERIKQIIRRVQLSLNKASNRLENDYGINNGHGMAKWSFIYSHQIGGHADEIFSFITNRRGWKVTGLVDIENKTLFFFLSQKNLEDRQNGKIQSKAMYYISALSGIINEDFESELDENQRRAIQLSWGLDFDEEEARQIYNEMLSACPCEIERFCVISLDMVRYELNSVKANVLNANFDVLYDEDWSNYITVPSNDDIEEESRQQEQQQHDMAVPLKRKQKKVSD
ncbi:DUF5986 family protein [Cytobacillus sp. FSL M8-0252]|uniref:DUF5986 family protein n=1 Tax=Cytobacillus sp. FSL M8-0252 TaxID=2921621 RepID=UPI0030FC80D5